MQCDRLMLMVGLSFLTLSRWLTGDERRFMIIPMLCVAIFVILVVWFLLARVARLMMHTPTAISIFVCLSKQDNHEYPFLYQLQTCHQVQPNQATYQKRQKCQPTTYLQQVLYQLYPYPQKQN